MKRLALPVTALFGIPSLLILVLMWCELLTGLHASDEARWIVVVLGLIGGVCGCAFATIAEAK